MSKNYNDEDLSVFSVINDSNFMDFADHKLLQPRAKMPKGATDEQKRLQKFYSAKIGVTREKEANKKANASPNTVSTEMPNNSGNGNVNGNSGTKNTTVTKDVEDDTEGVPTKTYESAQKRQFDIKKGHTGDKYISFDTLRKEKELAERNLRETEDANPQLQEYKKQLEYYKQLSDNIKKAAADGSGEIIPEEENKKLQAVNERINFLESSIYSMANPLMKDAPFSNPEDEKKWKELNKELAELSGQKAVIMDRINRGESFQELGKHLVDFTRDFRGTLGLEINEFGSWAKKDGSDVNEYQAQIAGDMFTKINQILEDGKVTPEEAKAIANLNKDIGKLIEEERKKDPSIMDAEDRVKSASAKQGYFLFDQIKAFAVLLVGLSQGNASMVYSAMDMFNKKIADAEADYAADEIKAFSNNNVKDVTSSADLKYKIEQMINDKAVAVKQLEKAFEEYQDYVASGGKDDFAVWFAAQQDTGSGWMGVIKALISSGALNSESLMNFLFQDETTSDKGAGDRVLRGKKGSKKVGYNMGTSGNTERLAQNILGTVKNEAEKGQQTKKLRDVQNTVNNAVASRMGGQGAAPQGTGNAAPINTSWGRA